MKGHEWIIGDVFLTTFWGGSEVCIIRNFNYGSVYFVRFESIRDHKTCKKDYCKSGVQIELFNKINKTFLHHSQWHSEYKK